MPEALWGYLLVGLVFFVLGRVTAGRGGGEPRRREPAPLSSAAPRPLELPAGLDAEIRELLDHDNTIQAIKRYREETGVDLKTAKDAVFEYREQLRRRGLV